MAGVAERQPARRREERADDRGGKDAGFARSRKLLVHRADELVLIDVVDIAPHQSAELDREVVNRLARAR